MDYKNWFRRKADKQIKMSCEMEKTSFIVFDSTTIEELYQMFKARLLAETKQAVRNEWFKSANELKETIEEHVDLRTDIKEK